MSILFGLLFLHNHSAAQVTFQRTFGGSGTDICRSVARMDDGGFVLAGYTLSFGAGSRDIFLIRTDSLGNQVWSRTYGGTNTDYAWTIDVSMDGGFLVGSHSQSAGAGSHDIHLLRCNGLGDTIWTRLYGGTSADGAYSLRHTDDGGYIVSAHTSSFGAGQHDVYLLKIDDNGDTAWTRTYGGPGGDFLRSVDQTSDGGFVAVAETFSFGQGSADIYLVRCDSTGSLLWATTYGGTGADYGYSVRETSDKGIILAGYTSSYGAGSFDLYLLKTDSLGVVLWAKAYGGASADYGYSVAETMDGGYIVAGHTQSFGVSGDVYIVRTDAVGNLIWSNSYGGGSADYGWSVEQTVDSGFIVAGYSSSFGAGSDDFYLIKTDERGNSGCNESPANTIVTSTAPVRASTQSTVSAGTAFNSSATIVQEPAVVEISDVCDLCECPNQGDFDENGALDALDIDSEIGVLFFGGIDFQDPECPTTRADFDASGFADAVDLNLLIGAAFFAGPQPVDPCAP